MLPLGCSLWDSTIIAANSGTAGQAVFTGFSAAAGLAGVLALTGVPALAAIQLDMPAPASVIGGRATNPSTLRLPIGPFTHGAMALREVAGAIDQRAYRMDDQRLTTFQILAALVTQLQVSGYRVIYQCETSACGGFDFRYGMDVLPEPQMHVDLGDFRYLAAERADPNGADLVALVVSRSADQAFVQVTTITPVAEAAAPATPSAAAPPKPEAAPELNAPSLKAGDFGPTLLTKGAVALDDLVFDSGSSTLEDKDYASLNALAAWLAANPARQVTLVGHTDAVGTLQANTALSRQRAQSVRATLIARFGAAAAQIDAEGAGYLAPRATNETPEGRTANRRVEVMLAPAP
jgi:outer membrane protein OmpA-like peptidoglycan-associated protein